MNDDPIVDEVRRAGEAYLQHFNFDVRAAMEDLRQHAEREARTSVSLPPKRPVFTTPAR